MAKKNFDSFLSNVNKAPKLSPEEIEEMTKEVHQKVEKKRPVAAKRETQPPPTEVPKEEGRRGRKPNPPETERMIRVSVDLPESVIIELKAKVVRQQTDMKNYIRKLVERELGQ